MWEWRRASWVEREWLGTHVMEWGLGFGFVGSVRRVWRKCVDRALRRPVAPAVAWG